MRIFLLSPVTATNQFIPRLPVVKKEEGNVIHNKRAKKAITQAGETAIWLVIVPFVAVGFCAAMGFAGTKIVIREIRAYREWW